MEKSAAQRLQAIIALMVGAFSFGAYTASIESRMLVYEGGVSALSADNLNIRGLLTDANNSLTDAKDRITYLEAVIKAGGD